MTRGKFNMSYRFVESRRRPRRGQQGNRQFLRSRTPDPELRSAARRQLAIVPDSNGRTKSFRGAMVECAKKKPPQVSKVSARLLRSELGFHARSRECYCRSILPRCVDERVEGLQGKVEEAAAWAPKRAFPQPSDSQIFDDAGRGHSRRKTGRRTGICRLRQNCDCPSATGRQRLDQMRTACPETSGRSGIDALQLFYPSSHAQRFHQARSPRSWSWTGAESGWAGLSVVHQ